MILVEGIGDDKEGHQTDDNGNSDNEFHGFYSIASTNEAISLSIDDSRASA